MQLSIDRGGNARDIGGRLEAFRDSVAAGQGPVGNILGRARDIIGRERTAGENLQTSYEEGTPNGVRNSGDVEARIARLGQQIERLTQEIHQLRNNGGSNSTQTGSPSGQPGASTPPRWTAGPCSRRACNRRRSNLCGDDGQNEHDGDSVFGIRRRAYYLPAYWTAVVAPHEEAAPALVCRRASS